MSWVVEWFDAGANADMPHHSEEPTLDTAIAFADGLLRAGARVTRMSGPEGESWSETHIKVEVEKRRFARFRK